MQQDVKNRYYNVYITSRIFLKKFERFCGCFFFFFLKANRKIKLLCGKQTHNATQSSENHLNNFLLLLLPKLNINKHIQTEFTLQRTSFSRRQTTSSPPTFAHSNIAFLEPYIFFFFFCITH